MTPMKTINTNIVLCLLVLSLTLLCACGGVDVNRSLDEAETELQAGNYESVISRCSELSDTTRVHLDLTQKCRLALLYGKLYDNTRDQSYASAATALFQSALAQNPDSVDAFFNSLGIDDQGVAATLLELTKALHHGEDMDLGGDYPPELLNENLTDTLTD